MLYLLLYPFFSTFSLSLSVFALLTLFVRPKSSPNHSTTPPSLNDSRHAVEVGLVCSFSCLFFFVCQVCIYFILMLLILESNTWKLWCLVFLRNMANPVKTTVSSHIFSFSFVLTCNLSMCMNTDTRGVTVPSVLSWRCLLLVQLKMTNRWIFIAEWMPYLVMCLPEYHICESYWCYITLVCVSLMCHMK